MKVNQHWPRSALDQLTEDERPITYGVVKPGDAPEDGVTLIRGGDVFQGRIALDQLRTISPQLSQTYKRTILRGGELLVSLVGNPGEVAIAPPSLEGANLARQVGLVSLRREINARFIMYFLMSPLGRAELFTRTGGAVQQVINLADLKTVSVPVPPRKVQDQIAKVLSAYDDLIENNRRRMALLEESARLLYQEWFVRLRFPGHEHSKFVDSSLGRIPSDWKVLKLDELKAKERYAINGGPFGSKLGTRDYVPSGVPVIRGANLSESGRFNIEDFVFVSDEKAVELHANLAKPGDIVVTQRGTLGQVGIIPKRGGFDHYVISQSQMKVTLDESLAKSIYIFYVLKAPETNASIKNRAVSSGVPHINLGILKNLEVLLPSYRLQELFTGYAVDVERAIELYTARNRLLASARDLLLPRLMSGEVAV